MLETYLLLESIAKTYEEIVLETKILKLPSGEASKLRIELVDGSFADVWISVSILICFHPTFHMFRTRGHFLEHTSMNF